MDDVRFLPIRRSGREYVAAAEFPDQEGQTRYVTARAATTEGARIRLKTALALHPARAL